MQHGFVTFIRLRGAVYGGGSGEHNRAGDDLGVGLCDLRLRRFWDHPGVGLWVCSC